MDGRFRRDVTQRLVVGLVEVTPNEPKPLVDEEVIQEYFRRYPNASPEDQRFIENSIRENHKVAKFTGTTHAEATLMGFLKSFPSGPSFANHDVEIEGVEFLKQLVEPVCLLFLPPCMYLMSKLLGRRLPLKTRSRSTKSVAVATGSGHFSVMLNGLARMKCFILGVLLEWEWMLLFSDLLRVVCGIK